MSRLSWASCQMKHYFWIREVTRYKYNIHTELIYTDTNADIGDIGALLKKKKKQLAKRGYKVSG